MKQHPYLVSAKRALAIEVKAIEGIASNLSEDFIKAIDTLLASSRAVVVRGVGKSGHIARKIAATLSSTGTPAFFVHPTEAAHGDLGVLDSSDTVIALSNSGESSELVALLPHIKRMKARIIAITSNEDSSLARHADVHLKVKVEEEACPLNLAPTASTTAALAMGDALAVVLLEARGFKAEDFARSHPGGSLGRRLLIHVKDVMKTGDAIPKVGKEANLMSAIVEMTAKGMAMTTVIDTDSSLCGVFTDGDLRRLIENELEPGRQDDWRKLSITQVMHHSPLTIGPDELASSAVALMEERRINQLVVVKDKRVVGAIHIHDLTNAKVV